jgi:hypothetical protein
MTASKLHSLLLTLSLLAPGLAAVAASVEDPHPPTTWAQMRVEYPAQIASACAAIRARAPALSTSPSTRATADALTQMVCECMPPTTDGLLKDLAVKEPTAPVSTDQRLTLVSTAFEQCRKAVSAPSVAPPSGDQGKIETVLQGFVEKCITLVMSRELTPPGPVRATADLMVANTCDCYVPEMNRSLRALLASSKGAPLSGDGLFVALREPTQLCGARMLRGLASLCTVIPDESVAAADQPAYCACVSDGLRDLSDEELLPRSSFTAPGEAARPSASTSAMKKLDATCRARLAPTPAASAPR